MTISNIDKGHTFNSGSGWFGPFVTQGTSLGWLDCGALEGFQGYGLAGGAELNITFPFAARFVNVRNARSGSGANETQAIRVSLVPTGTISVPGSGNGGWRFITLFNQGDNVTLKVPLGGIYVSAPSGSSAVECQYEMLDFGTDMVPTGTYTGSNR